MKPVASAFPAAIILAILLITGCSSLRPVAPQDIQTGLTPLAPPQWQAQLPHGGDATALTRWWQQFQDPALDALIGDAQAVSGDVASATSRIAQARAARAAAGAALGPSLDASASAVRGRQDLSLPTGTSLAAGLQAAWEIDLFGGAGAARDAAEARLESARIGWHDARVAVAAEVAGSYIALRACEAQTLQRESDAASRAETARLADLSVKAGFQAPADGALARASAAQARAALANQRAACDLAVKALAALSGLPEPALRTQLAATRARVPEPVSTGLGPDSTVPARALAQRPDLLAAERNLVAASAEVAQSEAQRLPRIAIAGSIGAARISADGLSGNGSTWSLGPLQITLPVFDGGTRRANVVAARARYDEAGALYRARLRAAVREVEEALVRLQSSTERAPDTQTAAEGFEAAFRATEARYKGGLASLFELEDARRNVVLAQTSLIDLRRERAAAWVQLYRALGGGWETTDLPVDTAAQAGSPERTALNARSRPDSGLGPH